MKPPVQANRARRGPNKQPVCPCEQTASGSRGRPGTLGSLRRALQFNDRQVLAPRQVAQLQFDHLPDLATHFSLRRGARRSPRPAPPRLDPRRFAGTIAVEVDLVGRCGSQPLVRTVAVVPLEVERQFPSHALALVRDQQPPRALVLHRSDEPLEDGDAAVLADAPKRCRIRRRSHQRPNASSVSWVP